MKQFAGAVLIWLALESLASPLFASPSPSPTLSAAESVLTFGVNPYVDALELRRRWLPLVEHLSETVGRPVELVVSASYAAHMAAVGDGRLDIAFLGPVPYVEMSERLGPGRLLARLRVEGETHFRGVIVARRDGGLDQLSQLIGRRFAFGDLHSTMSHYLPWYTLRRAGVGKSQLGDHRFLGSHDNVALGVLMGRFDAGGLKPAVFERFRARGLKVLAETPSVPNHVMVASSDLPVPLVEVLSAALYALEPGSGVLEAVGGGLDGFVPARDDEFDALRGILRYLKRDQRWEGGREP